MPTNSEKKPNGTGNGHAKDTTAGVLGTIQQRVTSRVDEQKNRAADGLGGIADVIRTASNELRMENEALASYVDMASDQMRKFANHIRERGAADMIDDVNRFARRNPAVFIGGAFLIGIGVARFLKASADRSAMRQYEGGFSDVDPMTANTAYSAIDESGR
ncbi:MAG TPA: hypothetical protein VNT81_17950 [Vicinamibacterales bacterium]|nr:hypothetical protein [Vicinamibacterales bacterium]